MNLPFFFKELSSLYKEHGFHLYLVGGSSRDLLLGDFCRDFDLVSDATPEEEKAFLFGKYPRIDFFFARFGTIKLHAYEKEIDIATFREEGEYLDYRHPSEIRFIRDMEKDSWRRDFTINALYIDAEERIYDFHGGVSDLQGKVIRFIGDPYKRIEEDPLRILRGERFASRLGFRIEGNSQKAMDDLRPLLNKLNPEKVTMEKKKR